jgi:hypothetical protein
MAYSTNPNLPKARAIAMQLLVREGLPPQVVANRCGVNRSTIWRWKRRWDKLNEHVQLANDNRPQRITSSGGLHLVHTYPQLSTKVFSKRHNSGDRCKGYGTEGSTQALR